MLLSCQWTVRRYTTYFEGNTPPAQYANDYRMHLRFVLHELRVRLRRSDTLTLSSCHRPDGQWAYMSHLLNNEIRTLAMHRVVLFDAAEVLDRMGDLRSIDVQALWPNPRVYLIDEVHQSSTASAKLGIELLQLAYENSSALAVLAAAQRSRFGVRAEEAAAEEAAAVLE